MTGPSCRSVFVLNSLCVGGAERQVVALLNGLARAPHQGAHHVTLACLKAGEALRPQLDPLACEGGLHTLGVDRGLDLGATRRLARLFDAQRPDVALCTNPYALLYAALARRWMRHAPPALVEVFHTTVPGSRKEAWSMPLYRALVRQCDLLVYVCEAQAAYWRARRWRAAREAVIHNGVDASRFALAPPPTVHGEALALRQRHGLDASDVVVGVCAVMRPEKAHRDLLQALARLASRHPRLRALLIGDGPERATIEREVQRLGLEGRVRITGLLDDVRPAMAACDVLAITSHAVETFSMAALEAMALGRALVMSEVGGAREQVVPGLTGWLYPAGDVEALSSCLEAAATNLSATHRMGQAAARRVRERFTEPSMVASYALALGQLAAARRRTPGDRPASWPVLRGPS